MGVQIDRTRKPHINRSATGTSATIRPGVNGPQGPKGDTGAPGPALPADQIAALDKTYGRGVFPEAHGAKGDGSTDDTAALQAWLASGKPRGRLQEGKTYTTTQTLTIPATMSIDGTGATIKATAAIAGPVVDTPAATQMQGRKLTNLTIDCNDLADTGLWLRYAAHVDVDKPRVLNAKKYGIIIGDNAATAQSYEVNLRDLYVWRPNGAAVPAGSYGLWMQRVSDSRIHGQGVVVGMDTGVWADWGGNQFYDVHVWGWAGGQPSTSFRDNAEDNTWVGCNADSPSQYGFYLTSFRTVLIGCHLYAGVNYPETGATGIYTDKSSPDHVILGCYFEGADGTHRLGKDFDGINTLWKSYVNVIGSRWKNVATQNLLQNQSSAQYVFGQVRITADSAAAWNVRGTDGTQYATADTNGKWFNFPNGMKMRGYSDNYSTQQWSIDSTTGAIKPGRYTTAGRPSAASVGSGGMIYDLTLNKPVWSDGGSWRDANGTVV